MNRALKFRAWNSAEHSMYQNIGIIPGIEGHKAADSVGGLIHDMYGSQPAVMQFTGLLDKNGREIYEGDLLSCSYNEPITLRDTHVWPHVEWQVTPEERIGEVRWEKSQFILYDHGIENWMLLSVADVKGMEILGNIYENPELVEEEKKPS